jgi:hypothetical protein
VGERGRTAVDTRRRALGGREEGLQEWGLDAFGNGETRDWGRILPAGDRKTEVGLDGRTGGQADAVQDPDWNDRMDSLDLAVHHSE